MKVKADITLEFGQSDISDMGYDIGASVTDHMVREIETAIRESEAFRDMKRAIYHACLDRLREEVTKEFVDKIKGGS